MCNNNGSFYCLSDKDLQKSIVHWLKVVNLSAYFPFLSLNSIQQPLHIWDRTFLVPLSKAPPNNKLFSVSFTHSVSLVPPHIYIKSTLCFALIFRGKYEICNPNKSVSAAALYQDLRYETFSECLNPCTKMKVATHYKFKLESQEEPKVEIIFPTEVELSVETVTKSMFSTSKIINFINNLY